VSIFKKITLLFSASLVLMIAIGYQMERLDSEKTAALVTRQYLQDARRLFVLLATADKGRLENEIAAMGLARADPGTAEGAETLLEQPHSFGELKVLRSPEHGYLLEIRYMDASLLLQRTARQERPNERWLPQTLVGLDIAVLAAIFLSILAMLAPLRRITETMRAFTEGKYSSRAAVKSSDEIGEVAATYNEMARHLQELIVSREELLRDIGHELRTPISKGLFALENLPESADKALLQRCFSELERLTGELLQIEKLDAGGSLQRERVDAETLILQALSKTMAEEEEVAIEIRRNALIEGDPDYLSLALKNLVDNALKYATARPVTIVADADRVCVYNLGKPLSRELAHYLQPFSRDARARRKEGFGLGLSIVKKIVERHGFELVYEYDGARHCFCIRF
jgi:two-component system OmpR family sensor kinase